MQGYQCCCINGVIRKEKPNGVIRKATAKPAQLGLQKMVSAVSLIVVNILFKIKIFKIPVVEIKEEIDPH